MRKSKIICYVFAIILFIGGAFLGGVGLDIDKASIACLGCAIALVGLACALAGTDMK